jgi:hypothetical protein
MARRIGTGLQIISSVMKIFNEFSHASWFGLSMLKQFIAFDMFVPSAVLSLVAVQKFIWCLSNDAVFR